MQQHEEQIMEALLGIPNMHVLSLEHESRVAMHPSLVLPAATSERRGARNA